MSREPSTHASPPLVLVVEDEPRLAAFILRALPAMGLRGLGAASPEEARTLLDHHDVRVLLLDIRLGPDSGLDLLEQLRQRSIDLPAVVMTAFADVPAAQRAIRAAAADFITKPFTLAQLESALARAVREAVERPPATQPLPIEPAPDHPPRSVDAAKREALRAALHRANGNKQQAARELGISRRTLYNWIERLSP
jgi:DNA-binding NtrC family response regulator